MGFANVRTFWGVIIIDKNTMLKICIPMWSTVAWLKQQQNETTCQFFWK